MPIMLTFSDASAAARARLSRASIVLGCMLVAVGCQGSGDAEERPGVTIGALLPFTGELAASGPSEERGIMLAIEAANRAGGIAGLPILLKVEDTHSDLRRGCDSAQRLFGVGVSALVGPDEPALAGELEPLLADQATVMLSGGISARAELGNEPSRWFRIFPSAKTVTAELAKRMVQSGVKSTSIVYVDDNYGSTFAALFAASFASLGASVVDQVALESDVSSIRFRHGMPDNVVLVAYPRQGALAFQHLQASGFSGKWFFAPTLDSEQFVLNALPGPLEGMVGISPALTADSAEFSRQFRERWSGAEPSLHANFYFDSTAVLALAFAEAQVRLNRKPSSDELAESVRAVSGPPGQTITWNELEAGMQAVAAGTKVNYRGVSGPIDFDKDGDVAQGLVRFWHVANGAIVRE